LIASSLKHLTTLIILPLTRGDAEGFIEYYQRSSPMHAGCIAASVGKAFSRVCLFVSLSVCPRSKRKTAWAINTKLGTRVLYSRPSRSAYIDPELKKSRSRG